MNPITTITPSMGTRITIVFALWALLLGIACQPEAPPCDNLCTANQACIEGQCELICPDEMFLCDGVCIDPWSNHVHCGGCNRSCQTNQECLKGICEQPCPQAFPTRCQTRCVDLQNDPKHCGICEQLCGHGQSCVEGKCVCGVGFQLCDGQCVQVQENREHCGRCGNPCRSGQLCTSGFCVQGECPKASPTQCFGSCVDLKSNRRHCGSCGKVCDGDKLCLQAECVCAPGFAACEEGRCTDLTNNTRHCGKCNTPCPKGRVCAAGKCISECPKATPTNCFGGCADTGIDNLHCGGCQRPCEPGLSCDGGICCQPGTNACDGQCVDLDNHLKHCGACGNTCDTGGECQLGKCCTNDCASIHFITGAGDYYVRGINVTSQGQVFVIGQYDRGEIKLDGAAGSSQTVLPAYPFGASFLARYDLELQAQWIVPIQYGARSSIEFSGIDSDQAGDYYFGSTFTETIAMAGQTFTSKGQSDIFIAHVTPNLQIKWITALGGTSIDNLSQMAVDPTGGVYFTGISTSTSVAGKPLVQRGQLDGIIGRLDTNGKLLWIYTIGSLNNDFPTGVAVDKQGNAYIAGQFDGTGQSSASFGQLQTKIKLRAAVILKVDPNGNVLWLKRFEGPDPNSQTSAFTICVKETKQGTRIFIGGTYLHSTTFEQTTLKGNGAANLFLLSMDESGKLLWAKEIGTALSTSNDKVTNLITSISVDAQERIHIGGVFESAVYQIGQTTFKNKGAEDAFLARYDTSGNWISAHAFGGNGADWITDVEASSQGTIYVTGFSSSKLFEFLKKPQPVKSNGVFGFLIKMK